MIRDLNKKEQKVQESWIFKVAGHRMVTRDELPELREQFKKKYGRYPAEDRPSGQMVHD